MNNLKRKLLLVGVLSLFIFSFFLIPVSTVNRYNDDNQNYTIAGTGNYVEDFTTTTYRDGATNAFGWGTGAVLGNRNFTWTLLDFESTHNPTTSIDVQGRNVYAAGYNTSSAIESIACYDINDPRSIRLLSSRGSLYGIFSIAVSDDILYGGRNNETQGFNTYNVQDPFGLGGGGVYLTYVSTDGFITDIEPEGHLIYHTAYNSMSDKSFIIVDASNPSSLRKIIPTWNSSKALGLDVNGHFAYIAASTEGFYILNITNKFSPIEVGHIPIPGNATDVIVDGRFAYLVAGPAGVFVIDIFNPAAPEIVGNIETPGFARQLVKKGNTIFVADGPEGVYVIDVANPEHPLFVTQIPLPFTWDVDLYGGDLVVGTNLGLHTFRIGYVGNFAVDWFDTPLFGIQAYDIRVQGDIAYIAAGLEGLYTINVHNPSNPVILDHYVLDPPRFLDALDIYGQFVIAICETGAYTFDVSNPANIKLTRFEIGTDLEDIVMNGPICYIAFGDPTMSGFASLNYTYASGGGFVANMVFGTNASTIDVQGGHVYIVENNGGIYAPSPYIYATAPDVFNPTFVGSYPTLYQFALDTFVDGDLEYISDTDFLVFFNVSDPTTPTWWGDVRYNGDSIKSLGVWADGALLMSASGSAGVYLLNSTNYINDPVNIDLPGSYNSLISGATKITANGDYAYVANETSLVILRHFKSAGATFIPGLSIAQSTKVSTIASKAITATLNTNAFVPFATDIIFYMSADGGAHWEIVTPGVAHTFVNSGNDLRWKAEILGPEYRSAHIYGVSISYEYNSFFNFLKNKWLGMPVWAWFVIGFGGLIIIITAISLIAKAVKKKPKVR